MGPCLANELGGGTCDPEAFQGYEACSPAESSENDGRVFPPIGEMGGAEEDSDREPIMSCTLLGVDM